MPQYDKTQKPRRRKSPKSTKRRKRILTIAAICGVILLAVFAGGVAVAYHYFYRPTIIIDETRYPVKGIDVSKHNGKIDFMTIARNDFQFVVIKATEGYDHTDPNFDTYYRQAREAGLDIGAYHFFMMNKNGKRQAEHFMKHLRGKEFNLPLVIDVEDWKNAKRINADSVASRLRDMITTIETKGYNVMVYTNGDGYRKYIKERIDIPVWICSFRQPENLDLKWTMHQYSHWGRIPGHINDFDLNIFNGTQNEYKQWVLKHHAKIAE